MDVAKKPQTNQKYTDIGSLPWICILMVLCVSPWQDRDKVLLPALIHYQGLDSLKNRFRSAFPLQAFVPL